MQPDIQIEEDPTQDLTTDLTTGGAPQARIKLSFADSARGARTAAPAPPKPLPPQPAPAQPIQKGDAEDRVSIAPGSVLCGRYLLELPLAKGGTSIVFRARDLQRTEAVGETTSIALKILRPELAADSTAIERLKREFRHAQSLLHPNIVRVFDLECDGGRWFVTMELLEGESLSALIKKRAGTALPADQVHDILKACGEALVTAHDKGIVHGDFKPGNVFLTTDGGVKVLDFGAATSVDPAFDEHFPAATVCYASPEVLSGQRPERRDDVFAFACVAYELVDGRHPFERRSALEANVRHMKPPRAWSLTDRQWFPLETALSFIRENRPGAIRPLLAELLASRPLPPLLLPVANAPLEMPAMLIDDLPGVDPLPGSLRQDSQPPSITPFRLVAALATLALVIAVAYSQAQRNPQAVANLRARVAAVIAGFSASDPPSPATRLDAAPASPSIPADPAESSTGSALSGAPANPSQPFRSGTPLLAAAPNASVPPQSPEVIKSGRRVAALQTDAAWASGISISFDTANLGVSEGAGAAVLTLRRQGSAVGRARVLWRAIPGSAQPGQDFAPSAYGSAEFADGQIRRAIYVPLVHDTIPEKTKEFTVELYNPTQGVQVWPVAQATVKIHDDD